MTDPPISDVLTRIKEAHADPLFEGCIACRKHVTCFDLQLVAEVERLHAEIEDWKHGARHEAEEADRLLARLVAAEAERDRLGVLDTVLKERRHHPDCPYKRECNCWLAAALTHRHDADLARLAAAEKVVEKAKVLRDDPYARGFSAALGEYALWGAVRPILVALDALDAQAQE